MKLFGKEEINTSRQFEFDFAKAVCILGMVFVHCFEELSSPAAETSAAYYVMVTVLDAIFGAGTFMMCMGFGIAYSWKENADKLIRRGIIIFLLGYLLNFVREAVPYAILTLLGKSTWTETLSVLLWLDIMPFAGLALMLFGLLKKLKFSDLAVLLTAIGMSVVGSFVRFLDLGSVLGNSLAGLFIGTCAEDPEVTASFPLLNWFLIVVMGYLYGKTIRRCTNMKRYYAVSLPVSAVFLAVYMLIAIPNRLGIMNEDILHYYQFTTPNALVLFAGMVFATGLYHFISLPFGEKVKKVITTISVNINRIYCIHWVVIGWTSAAFVYFDYDGIDDVTAILGGVALFVVANILAEVYARWRKRRALTKA